MSSDSEASRIAALQEELARTERKIDASSAGSTSGSKSRRRVSPELLQQYARQQPDLVIGNPDAGVDRTQTSAGGGAQSTPEKPAAATAQYAPTSPPRQSVTTVDRPGSRNTQYSDASAGAGQPEAQSVRSSPSRMASDVQSRQATGRAESLASGRSSRAFDSVLANMTDVQRNLFMELVDINGQDSYDSLTAGIGKLRKDEFLVLPNGFSIPSVRAEDVGKPIAHSSISFTDWAKIYALNKAVAPMGADPMVFGLLRLEAVKAGWVKDLREVRFADAEPDSMIALANDMTTLRERGSLIKTAAFLLPMAAEHTFRTMGHHFITSDQANYIQRYADTFRSCLMPGIAQLLPAPALYHAALHWVGPARSREVLMAQIDTPSIPDALRIRSNAAPAGTAILTTTAAIIDAMAAVGIDKVFEEYGKFGLPSITAMTEKVKKNPIRYHKSYFAYNVPRLSDNEMAEIEKAKKLAERFAPYSQAFIDTYMREAALGKARAIKKHADGNPIQLRRASTLFRAIIREKVTSVEDLVKTQFNTRVSVDDD